MKTNVDPHTFSGNPAGAVLATIIDGMSEKDGRYARARVQTLLTEARALVKLLENIPDRRFARYLLSLIKQDFLAKARASRLTTNAANHFCCVLTGIFRDAAKRLKSRFPQPTQKLKQGKTEP